MRAGRGPEHRCRHAGHVANILSFNSSTSQLKITFVQILPKLHTINGECQGVREECLILRPAGMDKNIPTGSGKYTYGQA